MKYFHLWPIIADRFCSKYHVVTEIDFLHQAHDPARIFRILASHRKETYLPHEKIVVYHYDTDYYLNNVGFTLYNFLMCLKFLNISPSAVVLFTNHHGILQEIKNFFNTYYDSFDYDCDSMLIFENNYHIRHSDQHPDPVETNIEQIRKPFSCMFGKKRSHRVHFHAVLQDKNILSQGICSWNGGGEIWTNNDLGSQTLQPEPSNQHRPEFLVTAPFSRINEHWAQNQELLNCYSKFAHVYDTTFKHPDIDDLQYSYKADQPGVTKAFLNVVCETVFQYPYPYFTEKTFRPILLKRPFVILGAPKTLAYLKSIGFKTFQDFWDESYDLIENGSDRLLAVADIVENIAQMTVDQLQKLCYSMNHILEYNYHHYVEHYAGRDLHKKIEIFS